MGQLVNVLLAIDEAHSTTYGPGLPTRLRWVKPGLWAQLFHSLCICGKYNNDNDNILFDHRYTN